MKIRFKEVIARGEIEGQARLESFAPMRILFLCTANACRSQMAEHWARHFAVEQGLMAAFASAGTVPSHPDARMLAVMAEAGVSVEGAQATALELYAVEDWDLAVTLCDGAAAACPLLPGVARTRHQPFPDPGAASGSEEEVLAEFRRVRDLIRDFVQGLLAEEAVPS